MANSPIADGLLEHDLDPQDSGMLMLVPMAAVAWADGNADVDEMESIANKQCKRMKSDENCVFNITLKGRRFFHDQFMYRRPDEKLTRELLDLLAEYLDSLPDDKADTMRQVILDGCAEVATASGGILGMGKISNREKSVLKDVTDRLRLRRAAAAYDRLAKLGV